MTDIAARLTAPPRLQHRGLLPYAIWLAVLALVVSSLMATAPALGALAALLGLPARSAVDAFIYMTTRDFVSAAVRLNLIGPLAAISLQSEVVSDVARRSADVMQLGCAGAAGSAPLPLVIPLPLMSTEDQ